MTNPTTGTIADLPPAVQRLIQNLRDEVRDYANQQHNDSNRSLKPLKAENANLKDQLALACEPGTWPEKTKKLVRENRSLRTRLRETEQRVAVLEARNAK
jgi:predicted nuclease with TOPRIM domain